MTEYQFFCGTCGASADVRVMARSEEEANNKIGFTTCHHCGGLHFAQPAHDPKQKYYGPTEDHSG